MKKPRHTTSDNAKKSSAAADLPDIDDRILSTEELLERVPLDRTTIWRKARDGSFPRPIQLTPARIGWRWSAVARWLRDREENPGRVRSYFGRDKAVEAHR